MLMGFKINISIKTRVMKFKMTRSGFMEFKVTVSKGVKFKVAMSNA